MSTNGVEKQNNGKKGLDLSKTYVWMKKTFSPVVDSAFQEFWDTGFDINLVNVAENSTLFMKGSEYFVTGINLKDDEKCTIRLSKEAVQILLDYSLGYNPCFVFEKITELEVKILTKFNNFIYEKLSEFIKTEEELQETEDNTEGETYLTFFIKDLSEEPAKIIITIPNKFLKYEEVTVAQDRYSINDFPNAKVNVGFYVGSATLTLSEVKHLEKEDIIVLDNSNINDLILLFEDEKISFKVSPDPSLIVSFDSNDGSKNMNDENKGNIWDNIQVDISAEFENVKISLGELKQISEGLVVDIGSIYENKVFLKVENKVLANGELVIINDRYGVKINEIVDDNNEAPQLQSDIQEEIEEEFEEPKQVQEEPPEPEPQVQENQNSDEFDYKDFDVDDENI